MAGIQENEDVVEIGANNILVIGSGGREHALAWKLVQSHQVEKVYVAPGNAGTETDNIRNVELDVDNHDAVARWCNENDVQFVVVGSEVPLANGIADSLQCAGVRCFGPSKAAAQLEASKLFAKQFMDRHNIPTARWRHFTDVDEAEQFIKTAPFKALVVKASGLAAGKGVVVAKDQAEACEAVRAALLQRRFGEAGSTVIVEELLRGQEISCIAITDGDTVCCLPPTRDYKRLQDGDKGPNTGGMGALCPVYVSPGQMDVIVADILYAAVDGMRNEGTPFVGALYAGLMLTEDGAKVLEFNCRFGDPETQVLMPLLRKECDLYAALKACTEHTLTRHQIEVARDRRAIAVVCASKGYPASYNKGLPISGLDTLSTMGLQVFHAGTARVDGAVVTSGGRVLSVVCAAPLFESAQRRVYEGLCKVQYEGKTHRTDIKGFDDCLEDMVTRGVQLQMQYTDHSHLGWNTDSGWNTNLSYRMCGVDVGAGDALVNRIKPLAHQTQVDGCVGGLGGFGGLFDTKAAGFKDPILVSGTDGVGTKLLLARAVDKHDSIGIDLVAMCVNDVLCHGAQPLFFLDYFACGKLYPDTAQRVIQGIVDGCKQASCALLGGETAEMRGMYAPGEYDIAGFAVGAVERGQELPRLDDISCDDVLIGIASSGVHSNGLSMVRHITEMHGMQHDMSCPWDTSQHLGSALLTPTRIYVASVLPLVRSGRVKAAAHITGGGLPANIKRVLPETMMATLDARKWPVSPVFNWLAKNGNVDAAEMAKTFNLGLGMVLVVAAQHSAAICQQLEECGEKAYCVGTVSPKQQGSPEVVIKHLENALDFNRNRKHGIHSPLEGTSSKSAKMDDCQPKARLKVAVLISGQGTNLQALIDHTTSRSVHSQAQIVLVVSNRAGAGGIARAQAAGIPTKMVSIKDYPSREAFDDKIDEELTSAGVEFICLAGFMRILTGRFVRRWKGRIVNIHPSLLPSFKGLQPHKQVLAAGVRVSGCTVHFVEEEVDAGAILLQEVVPVNPNDDEDDLQERVKAKEHEAYPRALELIASGRAKLGDDGRIDWTH